MKKILIEILLFSSFLILLTPLYKNNEINVPLIIDEYVDVSEVSSQNINSKKVISDDYIVTIKHKSIYFKEELFKKNSLEYDHFHLVRNTNPDEELVEYRKEVEKFYKKENEKIIKDLNLCCFSEQITYSNYAPFIQISFDNIADSRKKGFKVENLRNKKNVDIIDTIFINNGYKSEFPVLSQGNQTLEEPYVFEYALYDIGVDASKFQGEGIRIGVIENYRPMNLFGINSDKITFWEEGTILNHPHGDVVINILAGSYGISNNSHIYFASIASSGMNSFVKLYNAINWQLAHPRSVHIINFSLGILEGKYSSITQLLDFLSVSSKVTFVVASGNNCPINNSNDLGNGFNIISVGSTNKNKEVSSFSNYGVNPMYSGVLKKPSLVAPGEGLQFIGSIPNDYLRTPGNNITSISGTSFAAPMVTGIVALLIDQYRYLMLEPWNIHSILISSAKKIRGQTERYYEPGGFGLVHYKEAKKIINNNTFFEIYTSPNSSDNSFSYYSGFIKIPKFSEIELNVVMYTPQSSVSNFNNIQTIYNLQYTKYNISLINNLNVCVKNATRIGNYYHLTFSNNTGVDQEYVLKVQIDGSFNSQAMEIGGVTFFGEGIHRHVYRTLVSSNDFTHSLKCNCGRIAAFTHYVSLNENPFGMSNNKPLYCGLCGHELNSFMIWPAY